MNKEAKQPQTHSMELISDIRKIIIGIIFKFSVVHADVFAYPPPFTRRVGQLAGGGCSVRRQAGARPEAPEARAEGWYTTPASQPLPARRTFFLSRSSHAVREVHMKVLQSTLP